MNQLRVPEPRPLFDFVNTPEWKLEDRYQQLSITEAIGERKEQIVRELVHLSFELGCRVKLDEAVVL